jgi:GT2 family glycosyltransferase
MDSNSIAIVAIGRNEGDRLVRCLESIVKIGLRGVYVDSASTDQSVKNARALGFEVIELDMTIPFTAARARNEGSKLLSEKMPALEYIQFLDGDCELAEEWIQKAKCYLDANTKTAIVFGRRKERFSEKSIYNRICDLEWDVPSGTVSACGGDTLIRLSALKEVQGYDPSLIAGEEPEMCLRMRAKGWTIQCIAEPMTIHDAAMTNWRQWWKRSLRAGHAYAEVAFRNRHQSEKFWQKECRSILIWGLFIPVIAVIFAYPTWGLSLLLFGLYPVQVLKIRRYFRKRESWRPYAGLYAWHCVLAKWPQLQGLLRYHRHRLLSRKSKLIEYK